MRCPQCGDRVYTSGHTCTDFVKLQQTIAEARAGALVAMYAPEKATPILTDEAAAVLAATMAFEDADHAYRTAPDQDQNALMDLHIALTDARHDLKNAVRAYKAAAP